MKRKQNIILSGLFICFCTAVFGQAENIKPVSPNASPEAKALLQLISSLSGKYTLTGQHNFPAAKDRNSTFAAAFTGKAPVIWSTDFGFAKEGDKDSYLLRPAMVEEAKRQNQLGSIITLCWHAVPPTASEPVTFQPLPGADPAALASVQGKLTDQQFKDLLTPGTALYKHWTAQVDTIAHYLKELQKAHIAVLWRPYHEMNGDWFWWGNRSGQFSTQALYRQIFDRLVNFHKLNNLVWVWSVDRPSRPGMEFTNYFPGSKYLDIVALDVYGSDFKQEYYDQLLTLAKGKPVTLAEVGTPPSPEILASQPKWSYWVIWAGMVRTTPKKQFDAIAADPRVLGRIDQAYIQAANPFRSQLGLPLLPSTQPADFSGEWILNEDKSTIGNSGAVDLPFKLNIDQSSTEIAVKKSYLQEWTDDRVTNENMKLNGEEIKSEYFGGQRVTTANLSAGKDTLMIRSNTKFNRGDQSTAMKASEAWALQQNGKTLIVTQTSSTPQGERKIVLIYDKK